MAFSILDNPLPGVWLLEIPYHDDNRGEFKKVFSEKAFVDLGFNFKPAEHFFSRSHTNVLRGMHFQIGKSAHSKLLTCTFGKILDVIVDVRPNSAYYNQPYSVELSDSKPRAILIDKGYAHGFLTLSPGSIMHYMTSTVHDPSRDTGVRWSSIDFNWPLADPIISPRDLHLPPIGEHKCEFS